MFRKIMVAVIATYAADLGFVIQALLAILVVLLSLTAHLYISPYDFKLLHSIEKWSLVAALFTFYFSAYFLDDSLSPASRSVFAISIIFVNVSFVVYVIYVIRDELKSKLVGDAKTLQETFKNQKSKIYRTMSKSKDKSNSKEYNTRENRSQSRNSWSPNPIQSGRAVDLEMSTNK